ncbi:hypothetical protein L917_21453, partial [Phytophthora nicotianae]
TNKVKPPPLNRQAGQSRKRSKEARDFATEFFNAQVKGAQRSKRETYTCSRCQEAGHNVRSCTTPPMEIEAAG